MSQVRKRTLRWWAVNVVVPLLTVGLLVAFIVADVDRFSALSEVPLSRFVLVFCLVALTNWINSVEFWLLYKTVGAKISITENWLLFTSGQLLNSLPAQAGTLYRFRYLKVIQGLSYAKAASGYGANLVVSIMATGILGIAGSLLVGFSEQRWSVLLMLIFVGLVVGAGLTAVMPLPELSRQGKMAKAWNAFRSGWLELREEPKIGFQVLAIELFKFLITALRFQISFRWVGIDEPYALYLILAPVSALATFVTPTPAGLGFRELSLTGAAVALGRNFDDGLLGATMDRMIVFIVTLVVGGIGLAFTGPRLRRAEAELALAAAESR